MSRVAEIEQLERTISKTERELSELIHKTYHGDRQVWYQVGMSEHLSSWVEAKVIGPFDKFNIIIRLPLGVGSTIIDARSHRLRLDWKDQGATQ